MLNEPIYLTPAGKANLQAELEDLKGPKRTELAARLKAAIEMGDLSENADYKAAKEDQGFLEGRIQELEMILSNAEVVEEPRKKRGEVQLGSVVTVQEEGEEQEEYTLVGAKEANLRERKISYASPIGAALMGHKAGDSVEVVTPGGKIRLEILKAS